jgi:hypothetical protein
MNGEPHRLTNVGPGSAIKRRSRMLFEWPQFVPHRTAAMQLALHQKPTSEHLMP